MINFPSKRERVKCEENDIYLFIGGITEVKGIRIFCDAVTKANVKAIVVGQGILKEELEKKYPNINFVGWKSKEEMELYILQARCLVFPSLWYEVSPLTPLEVMAYGVPVVCSNLNASSNYIMDHSNGLIYDGNSVEGCLEKIEQLKNKDIVKLLSEESFKSFASENYSKKTYIITLQQIYSMVMLNDK